MALTGAVLSKLKAGSTMDSTERTQPARALRTEDDPRWDIRSIGVQPLALPSFTAC